MERLDPDLPHDRVRPMSAFVADGLGQSRLNLILMSLFGAAALLLSCVGIYGVFSYAVGQRTREIGIRMALGQSPGKIRNLVLLEGLRMIAISTGVGLFAATVLSRAISSLLYRRQPRRSRDVCDDGRGADGGGARGLLHPCAPGDDRQPDRRAASGVEPLPVIRLE